jgi:FkbM family methyltransferase
LLEQESRSLTRSTAHIEQVAKGFLRNRLSRWSEANGGFFFVQIGACDGISFDPIHELVTEQEWAGVLVEPVPHLFEELQANYRGATNLQFLNAAITDQPGRYTMYVVEPNESLPDWVKGVSSLHSDKNALNESYWETPGGLKLQQQGYRYEDLLQAVREIEVEGITWNQLISSHRIESVDLLQIDTEGHDYVILSQLNFSVLKPYCIQFEQVNLTDEEREQAISLLTRNGYSLYSENHLDYIAIDEGSEVGMKSRTWSHLYQQIIRICSGK